MDEIYSIIFNRIISGKYPAGTWLKQDNLAQEFNISRTPIRTVLQHLDQDGLVELVPQKGATVLPFTADEIEEIYEIRKSLELLCLDISASTLSIHKLLELKERILANTNSDLQTLVELDAELHTYIIYSTGKKRLISILDQVFRLIQMFRNMGLADEDSKKSALSDHIKIINALCRRDFADAKELMKKHIDNSKIIALSHLFKNKN